VVGSLHDADDPPEERVVVGESTRDRLHLVRRSPREVGHAVGDALPILLVHGELALALAAHAVLGVAEGDVVADRDLGPLHRLAAVRLEDVLVRLPVGVVTDDLVARGGGDVVAAGPVRLLLAEGRLHISRRLLRRVGRLIRLVLGLDAAREDECQRRDRGEQREPQVGHESPFPYRETRRLRLDRESGASAPEKLLAVERCDVGTKE